MVSTIQMITQVASLTLADYAEMLYAPTLLLDSKFDASLTDDPEFRVACEDGFQAYFDGRCEWNELGTETVLVNEPCPWAEVVVLVDETAWATGLRDWRGVSFAWGAGFGLGWLSAHALVKRDEAVLALGLLTSGIEKRMEKRRRAVA